MKSESGFVCVKADYAMVEKIVAMAAAVKSLVRRAETDHHFGRFNSVKTRKRRFLKDQVISYFDGDKFEGKFPALFEPIRFCYVYHDEFSGIFIDYSEHHLFTTGHYDKLIEIRDLITAPGCTLYLTPSQALLWKLVQLADIKLYTEAME